MSDDDYIPNILTPFTGIVGNAPPSPVPSIDPGFLQNGPFNSGPLSLTGLASRLMLIPENGQRSFNSAAQNTISNFASRSQPPAGSLPQNNPPPQAAVAGQYYLPGIGPTYLDPQFADRLGNFITDLKGKNIAPSFLSGYRDAAKQASLQSDPTAVTPARLSLHSTGQAVDINLEGVDQPTRDAILSAAARARLSWGGNFKTPDPNHFYSDPGGDRQQRIDSFTAAIAKLQDQIPDR